MSMDRQLIISLVSDQTIPNVQIIKEFGDNQTDYMLILTEKMERRGIANWILETCHIGVDRVRSILVEEYSMENIANRLQEYDFGDYTRIIVNLTGGTKIMVLSVFEFFKDISNTEICYVTDAGNEYLRITANSSEKKKFLQSISLAEYLTAYGFKISKSKPSGISFETTNKIYQHYINGVFAAHKDALLFLREKREKKIEGVDFGIVCDFLNAVEYTPFKQNKLSKDETKYFTGEWFEEYIGERIKRDLGLSDENIFVGTTIKKIVKQGQEINSVPNLLELKDPEMPPSNELDVAFIKNNKFYVVECKTSIFSNLGKNGQPKNILGETIYKSDALKTKFGLFAKSYIFTLSDLKQSVCDDHNKQTYMIDLIKRASLSNIKIVDKDSLVRSHNMSDLLF
jgi:hypothetical protein